MVVTKTDVSPFLWVGIVIWIVMGVVMLVYLCVPLRKISKVSIFGSGVKRLCRGIIRSCMRTMGWRSIWIPSGLWTIKIFGLWEVQGVRGGGNKLNIL